MEEEQKFLREKMVLLPVALLLHLAVILPGYASNIDGISLPIGAGRYLQSLISGRYLGRYATGVSKYGGGEDFKRFSKVNIIMYELGSKFIRTKFVLRLSEKRIKDFYVRHIIIYG